MKGTWPLRPSAFFLFSSINPAMTLLRTGELMTPLGFLDKNENDIFWVRRLFREAWEMVTTPVIRSGMRR